MNSRWSKEPLTRNGKVVSTRPNTPGDMEILKILSRHLLLTAADIAAVSDRSYPAIIHRLNKLKREPNQLITVHQTQLSQPNLWQWSPQAFHLTKAGEAKLHELGLAPKARGNGHFIHT